MVEYKIDKPRWPWLHIVIGIVLTLIIPYHCYELFPYHGYTLLVPLLLNLAYDLLVVVYCVQAYKRYKKSIRKPKIH